jgi:hypothetical protein
LTGLGQSRQHDECIGVDRRQHRSIVSAAPDGDVAWRVRLKLGIAALVQPHAISVADQWQQHECGYQFDLKLWPVLGRKHLQPIRAHSVDIGSIKDVRGCPLDGRKVRNFAGVMGAQPVCKRMAEFTQTR